MLKSGKECENVGLTFDGNIVLLARVCRESVFFFENISLFIDLHLVLNNNK